MMRFLSSCCVLAMLVFGGWGAYLAVVSNAGAAQSAQVIIENPVQDLGNLLEGKHEIAFRITNPTAKQVRVVWSPGYCTKTGCIYPAKTDELIVPPGGTVEVPWVLKIKPIPFSVSAELYVIGESLLILPISVHGQGAAQPGLPQ